MDNAQPDRATAGVSRARLVRRLAHWNRHLTAHHEPLVVHECDADDLSDEELRKAVKQTVQRALRLIETDNY